MPPSISLSGLSWSKPDGTPLLTDVNLAFGPGLTGITGRNGVGKSTLLRLIAGDLKPAKGKVRVTGTFAMMRQDVIRHPDDTIADLFGCAAALALLGQAEAGLADATRLAETDWTLPQRIEAALARCDLFAAPETPLIKLSGGQRSRAALAALVFAEPDFLLLDEPTNNLDCDGRNAVISLLRGWAGGAIIVSHDRALLDEMSAIIELSTLGATRFGGNYSAFKAWKERELDAAARALAHAERTSREVARRAQQAAERKARKDSAGHKARAKGGQSKIMMDAAKGRAEASGAAGVRLREARRAAAEEVLKAACDKIEILQPVQMAVPTTGLSPGKRVLRLTNVFGGYDPRCPVIRDLSLSLMGPERVVIQGRNGAGKTTLLKLIMGQLIPFAGKVECFGPIAMLDQHVGLLDPALPLRENFARLNPAATAHSAHMTLARFGFRAGDALRHTGSLSGGERLRAGLACTLGALPTPELLILDEPTNNLDLESIATLEAALVAYDGAILAVSHDAGFLNALRPQRVIQLPE